MLRALCGALLAVSLAGCSMGPQPVLGFSDTRAGSPDLGPSARLGGDDPRPRARRREPTRTAKFDDKAPSGSFEMAPRGALSDRDYSSTRLDPERALVLINDYRRSRGLKPLRLSAELTAAAKAHSRDLAKFDRISHFGSDGSTPWDRVRRTGYKPRLAAENVGTGQVTIEEVFRGWRKSPGHDKNLLLADAEQAGIALVYDPKTEFKTFWTLVIGTRL